MNRRLFPSRGSALWPPAALAVLLVVGVLSSDSRLEAARPEPGVAAFLQTHCADCHDAELHKGGLDLGALEFAPDDPSNFTRWVTLHDRVRDGEMPPPKRPGPSTGERARFLEGLASPLTATDQARTRREGRSTLRRLNRYEYENALRDLLGAPWLAVREMLPEDGVAHRFNKVGEALDVSHVQMSRYLAAADYALRQVLARQAGPLPARTERFHARDQRSFTGPMKFSVFNTAPERATFPVLGTDGQPEVRAGQAPLTVGTTNAALRELEGVGVVASAYEPLEPKFNAFKAPTAGRYKLRLNALAVWVGPGPSNKWFIPNLDDIQPGRRAEPLTLYAESPPRQLRWLGRFDVTPEAEVRELEVWLHEREMIRPDAARLFRSRPGPARWQNPLAEKDGQPGVVFRWLEVEGPLHDTWPPAGHRLLFGDHPVRAGARPGDAVEVIPEGDPRQAAETLLANFVQRAYRRPVTGRELQRFLPVIERALEAGHSFVDAMVAGYAGVLCSPEFIYLQEAPGRLDDHALAARLAFFLWNGPPDAELRAAADRGKLADEGELRRQTTRLLDDPRSRRFVDAFLDYWLDLRRAEATSPDATLYPDYYLDDLLVESAVEETQRFFGELLRGNLPVRNLVAADFAMLNERLATHYGLPGVEGAEVRRVSLPADSVRGGLLTQASVLKVTANGTTTSPVLRGAWIVERILGQPVPPPPAAVPAVEPDIRGAITIRAQLEKHRTQESCNGCHARMDPAGFALENFDVLGGWRERYRAQGEGSPEPGIGKGGQKFEFHPGLPVDATGTLPDGRAFVDVRDLRRMLAGDEGSLARNLARQLVVYATGAPVRFGDRPEIERILERASGSGSGVRRLVEEVIQSDLFRMK